MLKGLFRMNYYDMLKLSPNATQKEINEKHRVLAKKYHPDVNKSKDAHKIMTKLNEMHEVLSDASKRQEYDNKLSQNQRVSMSRSGAAASGKWQQSKPEKESRSEQAERMRRNTEAKMKAEEAERLERMAYAQKRADDKAKEKERLEKLEEVDTEKEQMVDLLSMLVRKGNSRLRRKLDLDKERHHAVKVLLSLVREDDSHLRRIAEEAERKQRIDEILELVKANNEGKDKLVE